MKTILVTGSDGFTGHYVADELENKGYSVVRLVHINPSQNEVACDLTDKESVRRVIKQYSPDGVIHLAALSYVAHEDQSAFYGVNVFGALNLLEVMDEEGIVPDKVVIASSANIYGNPNIEVLTETDAAAPVNHYAASKLAMEYMVKTWFSQFPIIITRPFNYTGIGQDEKFLVPKITSHFKSYKKKIELGNTNISRDFSDVRDVALAYRLMLESSVSSEIVNICSGVDISLNEIIQKMNKISGYEINVSVNPDFVRKSDIVKLRGDNSKLKHLFNYSAKYTIDDTLGDMFCA